MFRPEPQLRFLLRGSALLIVMLALWWLALRPPMLYVLRLSESIALRLLPNADSTDPIQVDASGDWNFRIPVEDTGGETIRKDGPVKFRHIEFTIPRPDVVLFTFSLPVFWAMVLAAPIGRSGMRALLWGTALVFAVEVLSLMAQAEMIAYSVAAQLHLAAGGLAGWLTELGTRLVVGVVPFAAPVVIAVALHRDLRSQIFAPQGVPSSPGGGRRAVKKARKAFAGNAPTR